MTIGFALQLWGGPFQRRLPGLHLRQSWASSSGSAAPPCPPRQRLVFLKTHKSGSSSVLSLLHRYGDRHGLRFALPARYQFGYPRLFQASRVKGYRPQGGDTQPPFHILCHHMRFNLKEVRGVEGAGGIGEKWARAHDQDHQGRKPQAWGFSRHHPAQRLGMGTTKVRILFPSAQLSLPQYYMTAEVLPSPSGASSGLFP